MKSFVMLTGVLLLAVVSINGIPRSVHLMQQLEKNFDECREELGLTAEEERKLHRKRDFKEKMRCMPACLMKKEGILEEDKKLNITKMVEEITQAFEVDPVEAEKIIAECAEKAQVEEDECDFAKSIKRCVHKNMRCEFKPPGHPPPMTGEMKKNFDECKEELGITEEEARELFRKQNFNHEKMRCMPACLMKKDGFLEEGNKINIEKTIEVEGERFPAHEINEDKIKACVKKVEDKEDECDFARSFIHCIH